MRHIMTTIHFSQESFFVGPKDRRVYYRVNVVALDDGIVGYNAANRELIESLLPEQTQKKTRKNY